MRRALLLMNPKARRGAELRSEAEAVLTRAGIEVRVSDSCEALEYPELISKLRGEIDLVVVGGGDGSLKCAAPAVYEAKLPLGILPVGTANNVARSLQIPESVAEACQVILDGKKEWMD
jgi:diacylglycerol kinase (ATP)